MLGELFAFISSSSFALSNIYLRLGQERRPGDSGIFMASLINCAMFLLFVLAAALTAGIPPFNRTGFWLFILAGVMNTLVGRGTLLSAIRSIGPSRAVAYKSCAPGIAMLTGYFFLGEPLSAQGVIGAAMSIAGLVWITRETARLSGSLDLRRKLQSSQQGAMEIGVLLGMASAAAFGLGFVIRKAALLYWPTAEVGSLLGSAAALACFMAADAWQGRLREVVRSNVLQPVAGFIWGGVLSSVGMITTLLSLIYAPVATAAVIGSLDPLWSLLVSPFLLGRQERLNWQTGAGVVVTLAGVILIITAS